MARLTKTLIIFAPALLSVACGGEQPDSHTEIKRSTLSVAANPPGHTFTDAVTVELSTNEAADIFYTLDGSSPSGKNGIRYEGGLHLEEDALLTFIAVDGDRFSPPVTELYEKDTWLPAPDLLARALNVDDDVLVFTAQRGEPGRMSKSVRVQSVGLQQVLIEDVYITVNPESWSFWEKGAFEVETDFVAPGYLAPGESIELTVTYEPTETIRTGLLVVQSDDLRHEEGYVLVDLMGRIFDW